MPYYDEIRLIEMDVINPATIIKSKDFIWINEYVLFTLYYKVLFMREQNQQLEALKDIRQMMQRSSRFISLSGLSGIAAGIWAIIGAWFAHGWIKEYYVQYNTTGNFSGPEFQRLKLNLFLLAGTILCLALLSAFYFT